MLTDKVGRTAMIKTNGSRSQRVRFGPRSAIAKALVGLAVGSLLIGSGCADLGERGHHLHAPRAEAQGPPAIPDRLKAAEDLAQAIPSGEMGQILAGLERTIGACVACHRVYKR